jgi:hypothetical protein
MATFAINSKKHGKISFFMPNNGGYVRLESDAKPGTLGDQICEGGHFLGDTIFATEKSFESICKKWHRQRMAAIKEYDDAYEK